MGFGPPKKIGEQLQKISRRPGTGSIFGCSRPIFRGGWGGNSVFGCNWLQLQYRIVPFLSEYVKNQGSTCHGLTWLKSKGSVAQGYAFRTEIIISPSPYHLSKSDFRHHLIPPVLISLHPWEFWVSSLVSGPFFHPQPPSLLFLLLEPGSERKVLTKETWFPLLRE